MTASLLRADAIALPLRDSSVDLVVTSPPYFALRSYQDGGEHYDGQIGSEDTPTAFLAALWAVLDECWRVLKPTGSVFVNLGDKYSGAGGPGGDYNKGGLKDGQPRYGASDYWRKMSPANNGIRAKSLMLLPEQFRLGAVDPQFRQWKTGQSGPQWIARSVVIWDKPNCLSGGAVVYARVKGRHAAVKVHDLCRAYQPDDVQLWNGERWTQVVWWQPTGRNPTGDIEIELRSGERIGCTSDHRWPTDRGLLHASDLRVGDTISTAPLPEGDATPSALDDDMVGWFVGLYIAEGSRSEGTIQIAGHVNEIDRYKRLADLADSFHGTCRVHPTGGNTATINLTGRFLDAILDTYVGGRTAKDKHLAPKGWTRSNRFLRAVLDGYLSGDGHYEADTDRWKLGFTSNDYLASDLRVLAARLGLSLRLRRTTHSGFGKEWPGWGGTLVFDPGRRRRPDSQIVAIRQSRARQFWDIGVADEPHLFALGSGVLTHNSLPESVTDRVRRSHEDWVHLTKQGRYFAAVDEIREPHKYPDDVRDEAWRRRTPAATDHRSHSNPNPLGKLPGSVWTITSEPLKVPDWLGVDHFAAFPQEWPRRIILGWSPSGYCTACDEPRRAVVDKAYTVLGDIAGHEKAHDPAQGNQFANRRLGRAQAETTVTGYACACHDTTRPTRPTPPTRPSVVLDPFGGTGTTTMVARALGRHGVHVDLSADYLRLARWRIHDSGHAAKTIRRTNEAAQLSMLA